jgi:hypothetical protein
LFLPNEAVKESFGVKRLCGLFKGHAEWLEAKRNVNESNECDELVDVNGNGIVEGCREFTLESQELSFVCKRGRGIIVKVNEGSESS